jgi:hypothetical protein
MNSNKKTAGIAGLLYLITLLTGTFNLAYVPSKLIVWNNAATTFNNIRKANLPMLLPVKCLFIILEGTFIFLYVEDKIFSHGIKKTGYNFQWLRILSSSILNDCTKKKLPQNCF